MRTLEELKERIADTLDELTILEVLEIKADSLVEMYEDRIEERFDELCEELFSDDDDSSD
jgi:hypothetical protein